MKQHLKSKSRTCKEEDDCSKFHMLKHLRVTLPSVVAMVILTFWFYSVTQGYINILADYLFIFDIPYMLKLNIFKGAKSEIVSCLLLSTACGPKQSVP